MNRAAVAVTVLTLVGVAACGDGKPVLQRPVEDAKKRHRYELVRPSLQSRPTLTAPERRWRESLVGNLRHRGEVLTYVKTTAPLLVAGTPRLGLVYVNASQPDQFYVAVPYRVIVDFRVREIGTSGTDGVSFHPHPTGRIVIALLPTPGTRVLGVCLSDESKCGKDTFRFRDDRAEWTWGP